jgi:hypothetical protein
LQLYIISTEVEIYGRDFDLEDNISLVREEGHGRENGGEEQTCDIYYARNIQSMEL